MSLRFFEGVAGSGKTTTLLHQIGIRVREGGLAEDQRVLALTFMHGSRRRLDSRLRNLYGLHGRYECTTIDSFALHLLRRWRSSAAATWGADPPVGAGFDVTCARAAELLNRAQVRDWVVRRFPILVIDELQDCRQGRLAIVGHLECAAEGFAAGDMFQDLSMPRADEAIAWARSRTNPELLQVVHRTDCAALLRAATDLRRGAAVAAGQDFTILYAQNPSVAASFLARNLTWWWSGAATDIAVLTPTGADNDFVRRVLTRLAERPFTKDGQSFGPFTVTWEDGREAVDVLAIATALQLDRLDGIVTAAQMQDLPRGTIGEELRQWSERERRLRGRCEFASVEVQEQLERARHVVRSYGCASPTKVRVMTIHQAKNREFESVVVLWPLAVGGDAEQKRRLLYNAITRARRRALVVAQDPPGANARMRPPFVP